MKAISLPRSLILHFLPVLVFGFWFWKAMPFLDWFGKPLLYMFCGSMAFLSFQWMAITLFLYRREKNPPGSFWKRFRFDPIRGAGWLWCFALGALLLLSQISLGATQEWIQQNWISPPKFFFRMMDPDPTYLMDVLLKANWMAVILFFVFVVFQIFVEELWFRGYILPRQELSWGKNAWLYHALLWWPFLSFQPWNVIAALPYTFLIAFVATRTQNTSVTVLARLLALSPLLVRVVQGAVA